MKLTKKVLSIVLAMVMVLAMAVPTMAAATGDDPISFIGPNQITINNPAKGYVYEAYQVFKGDIATQDEKYILSNITWGDGVKEETLLPALNSIPKFGSCKTAEDVAKVLEENINDSALAAQFAETVSKHLNEVDATSTHDEGPYIIAVSAPGYYFVQDQEGTVGEGEAYTKFILEVVGNADATPKMSVPEVTKKVYEEDYEKTDTPYDQGYNDVADYDIGDKVPFAFYSKVPNMDNYEEYFFQFVDTMSPGLTFNSDSVEITIGGREIDPGNYVVSEEPSGADYKDASFTITITNLKSLDDISEGDQIVVKYTATLNENAELGLDGNTNEVYLVYTNNPNDGGHGKTVEDKVIVFTFELDVTKVDGADETNKLAGAEFKLYRSVPSAIEGESVKEYVVVDENSKVVRWTTNEAEASTLTSSEADGLFKVSGLDDGTYFLKETKAPAGYNLLPEDVEVTITATTDNGQEWNGTASSALTALKIDVTQGGKTSNGTGNMETGIVSATITNNKGSQLPETGGIGTTIFYVVGGILVVGAVILLVTKKRMSKEG